MRGMGGLGLGLSRQIAGGGVPSQDLLEDIIPSTVFDIVATDAQTQPNLTVNPADGSGQTAYNFTLGATTTSSESTDPTFTAGSPNYLNHDGGDYQTLVGDNTAFFKNMHKRNPSTPTTIGIAFRTPSSVLAAGADNFFSTGRNSAGESGIVIDLFADGTLRLVQRGDSQASWSLPAGTLVVDTDYYVLVGFDWNSSTTNVHFWVNSTTGILNTDDVQDEPTTDPSNKTKFGASNNGGNTLVSGYRIYAQNAFNEVISDATAALAFANMEARLGLDFTP